MEYKVVRRRETPNIWEFFENIEINFKTEKLKNSKQYRINFKTEKFKIQNNFKI